MRRGTIEKIIMCLALLAAGALCYLLGINKINQTGFYGHSEGHINAIYEVEDPSDGTVRMRATARYMVNDVEYICELKSFRHDWQVGDKCSVDYDVRYPSEPLGTIDPAQNALKMASLLKLLGCIFAAAAFIPGVLLIRNRIEERKNLHDSQSAAELNNTVKTETRDKNKATFSSKSVIRLLVCLILVLSGIGLQFVTVNKQREVTEYVPVDATVVEVYQLTGGRGYNITRFRAAYELEGIEYQTDIELPYVYWIKEGETFTEYYRDEPSEAVASYQLDSLTRKAPVPGYVGWVLIAAGVGSLFFNREKP